MSYGNLKALEMVIKKEVENTLRSDVAKDAVEKHKKSKRENVYSRPESDSYSRTDELLESSVAMFNDNKSNDKKLVLEIYDETSDFYNPSLHPSWVDGSNQNKNIPKWINYGHGGIANYAATNYIEKAREEINQSATKVLKQGLKKRGINSTIK